MNTNCTSNLIDISVELSDKTPVWPGGYGFNKHQLLEIGKQSDANVSRLDFDVHSGTHIDAPLHFVAGGKCTADIPLDILVGTTVVWAITGKSVITCYDFQERYLPTGTQRILLKTDNSANAWFEHPFDTGFVAIDCGAAEWLVEKGIKLIGIDGPSIQKYDDPKDTHVILLKNEVVILEGLNLQEVNEGVYELTCLPMSVAACEGISARAILKRI